MVDGFILTFSLEDDFPYIDFTFQIVKKRIFENATPLTCQQPDCAVQIENSLECYNLTAEEEEYPRNIDISEL